MLQANLLSLLYEPSNVLYRFYNIAAFVLNQVYKAITYSSPLTTTTILLLLFYWMTGFWQALLFF
jgi:hypothetical protein